MIVAKIVCWVYFRLLINTLLFSTFTSYVVSGLTETEKHSSWKVKQHKRYGGNIYNVRRNIKDDIHHGVTREEVAEFLNKIKNDSSFSDIRRIAGSIERIKDLEIEGMR